MWRNGVLLETLLDGTMQFTAWEPATLPDVGPPSHGVTCLRDRVPWGLITSRTPITPDLEALSYALIEQAFPAAADGERRAGTILLKTEAA